MPTLRLPSTPEWPAAAPGTALAPGPRGVPFLGSLPEMQRKGQLQMYLELWRRFGDVARLHLGPITAYLLARPAHIGRVLVEHRDNYRKGIGYRKLQLLLGQGLLTSEGALWTQQRHLMQPLFAPKAVMRFAGVMADATEAMLRRWQARSEAGGPLDVDFEMTRLAVSIISRTMFHANPGHLTAPSDGH